MRTARLTAAALIATAALAGCAEAGASDDADAVRITGSATVEPIMTTASRESKVPTSIEAVGTNAGFETFCAGEADIVNASTQIPGPDGVDDFRKQCADNGVEYVEVPVAIDALSIVVNKDNADVSDITMDELAKVWGLDAQAKTWSDVRPEWPDEEIVLFGRDADSGTHAVFTELVNDEPGAIREGYQSTHDMDELAQWVADEPYGMAFMGIGNYLSAPEDAASDITTVTVDGHAPDRDRANSGAYPMARPLYVYVSTQAMDDNDNVSKLVEHLLDNGNTIVPRAAYYPLEADAYDGIKKNLNERVTGPQDNEEADDA